MLFFFKSFFAHKPNSETAQPVRFCHISHANKPTNSARGYPIEFTRRNTRTPLPKHPGDCTVPYISRHGNNRNTIGDPRFLCLLWFDERARFARVLSNYRAGALERGQSSTTNGPTDSQWVRPARQTQRRSPISVAANTSAIHHFIK